MPERGTEFSPPCGTILLSPRHVPAFVSPRPPWRLLSLLRLPAVVFVPPMPPSRFVLVQPAPPRHASTERHDLPRVSGASRPGPPRFSGARPQGPLCAASPARPLQEAFRSV